MRPVERQPVAVQAAKQLVHRHAQPFALDVIERDLDRGEDLHPLRDTSLANIPEAAADEVDPARVLADQLPPEDPDRLGEDRPGVPVIALAPTDDALVGGDLDEQPVAATDATVAGDRLDRGDLHGRRSASERMGQDDLLDDVGAPARPVRNDQLAVLDLQRMGQQVALPRDVIQVDLEDLHVGHGSAQVGVDQRPERAHPVVGRDHRVVELGHLGDAARLRQAVGQGLDHHHVRDVLPEERPGTARAG